MSNPGDVLRQTSRTMSFEEKEQEALDGLVEMPYSDQRPTIEVTCTKNCQLTVKSSEKEPAMVPISELEKVGISIKEKPSELTGALLNDADCTEIISSGDKRPRNCRDETDYVRFAVKAGDCATFPLHNSCKAVILPLWQIRKQFHVLNPTGPLSPAPLGTRGGGKNGSDNSRTFEEMLNDHFKVNSQNLRDFPIPDNFIVYLEKVIKCEQNCIALNSSKFATFKDKLSVPLNANVLIFGADHQKRTVEAHQQLLVERNTKGRMPNLERDQDSVWRDVTKIIGEFGFRAANKDERKIVEEECKIVEFAASDLSYRVFVWDPNVWNKKGYRLTVRVSFSQKRRKCMADIEKDDHLSYEEVMEKCVWYINQLLKAAGKPPISI